jgi:anoctamin-10
MMAINSYFFLLIRFIFELFTYFSHLAYLSLVRVDMDALKRELINLYTVDEIRRVVTETLIPLLTKKFKKCLQRRAIEQKQKKEDLPIKVAKKILEADLPEYQIFEDYLEIIFQFTYLTVFACVFPQASYLSFLFSLIEYFSDNFKLKSKLYKKPFAYKTQGIGTWLMVLNFISFLGVYTNSWFFAFSFYSFSKSADVSGAAGETAKNAYRKIESFIVNNVHDDCGSEKLLLAIFTLEHFIIVFLVGLRFLIKDKPKWVRVFLKRQRKKIK